MSRLSFAEMLKQTEQKKQENAKLELVKDTQPTQPTQETIPTQPTVDKQPNQDKTPNQPDIPTQPTQPKTRVRKETSPKGDWGKSPNSLARDLIPERHFKGLSFQTYDILHLRTRRANPPVRRIQATKSDLMRWTGLSDVTLDKHIKYLKDKGFIDVEFMRGNHDGNWYEVFTPDELPNLTNPTQDNQANQSKKVGGEIPNLVGGVGGVDVVDNKEDSDTLKTIYKTNTYDDEAYAKFNEVSRRHTGKDSTYEEYLTFMDLMLKEVDAAAAKTSVSSMPAFAAKIVEKKIRAFEPKKGSEVKPDIVGKPSKEIEEYQTAKSAEEIDLSDIDKIEL